MYLVYDDFGVFTKEDYKGLKQLLVSEIKNDTKKHISEEDIVLSNMNLLGNIIEDSVNIVDELKAYGFCVKDLFQIHRDVADFISFYREIPHKQEDINALEKTLELIGNEF